MLKNKLGITSSVELAKIEEQISKKKAAEIYSKNILDKSLIGTFKCLQQIHQYMFDDIYEFAGKLRTDNIAKGSFRFASVLYLEQTLIAIDKMPQGNFEQIVEKYVEMNIAHPFREGNGRSTRIWLDLIFRNELNKAIMIICSLWKEAPSKIRKLNYC